MFTAPIYPLVGVFTLKLLNDEQDANMKTLMDNAGIDTSRKAVFVLDGNGFRFLATDVANYAIRTGTGWHPDATLRWKNIAAYGDGGAGGRGANSQDAFSQEPATAGSPGGPAGLLERGTVFESGVAFYGGGGGGGGGAEKADASGSPGGGGGGGRTAITPSAGGADGVGPPGNAGNGQAGSFSGPGAGGTISAGDGGPGGAGGDWGQQGIQGGASPVSGPLGALGGAPGNSLVGTSFIVSGTASYSGPTSP